MKRLTGKLASLTNSSFTPDCFLFSRKRNSRSAGKSVLRWLDQSLLRESTGEENSNFFSLVSGSRWVMGTSGDFLTCALEMVEVWLNMTLRRIRRCFFKPLHPYISMYILRTVLYIFSKVLTRRVWFTIESYLSGWSFPLFSAPVCVIQGWCCKEKIDAQRGLNG